MKKTLLSLMGATTFISTHGMNDPFLIAEQNKTISVLEQKELQCSYAQWEKVTQTKEFLVISTLLTQHPSRSDNLYFDAFAQLHATEEFKAYITRQHSLPLSSTRSSQTREKK